MKLLLLFPLCSIAKANDLAVTDEVITTESVSFSDSSPDYSSQLLTENQLADAKVLEWVTVTDTHIVTAGLPSSQTTTSTSTVVNTVVVTATGSPSPSPTSNAILTIPDLKLGSAPVVIGGTTYVFPGYTALGTEITGPATAFSMFIEGPSFASTEASTPPVSYTDSISYLDPRTYIYVSALNGPVSYSSEEEYWPTCTEAQSFSSQLSSATTTPQSGDSSSTSSSSSTSMSSSDSNSIASSAPSSSAPISSTPISTTASATKASVPAIFSQKLPGYICQGYDPSLSSLVCLKSDGNALTLSFHVLALALAFIVFIY